MIDKLTDIINKYSGMTINEKVDFAQQVSEKKELFHGLQHLICYVQNLEVIKNYVPPTEEELNEPNLFE